MTATRTTPAGWDPDAWSAFCADLDNIALEATYADPRVFRQALNEITFGMEPVVPPPVREALILVARKHQASATGHGEMAFNIGTRTALYVAGDWTDVEPIEADCLAVEGVDHFEYEFESLPSGWWDDDTEIVYPDNPPKWVTDQKASIDFEYESCLALARAPLVLAPLAASVPSRPRRSMPYRVDVGRRQVLTASGGIVMGGWDQLERHMAARGAVEADVRRAGKSSAPVRGFARIDMRARQAYTRSGRRVVGGYQAAIARLRRRSAGSGIPASGSPRV